MDKKMKLPFLSKNPNTLTKSSSSWPWTFCYQPRTLSFRNNYKNENTTSTMFKAIINSEAYLLDVETTESSLFTNTSESAMASFSTSSEEYSSGGDPIETVIKGLRSERLFFEPGGETSSILEDAKSITASGFFSFKESLVLSMESQDPYIDFKKSMEEMVEAHGLNDWEYLEELLCWYLRMNGKSNHGYIVCAFVDLLASLAFASSSSNGDFRTCSSSSLASNNFHSPSSPLSFYTSFSDDSSSTPCCSSSLLLEAVDEDDGDKIEKQQEDDDSSSS